MATVHVFLTCLFKELRRQYIEPQAQVKLSPNPLLISTFFPMSFFQRLSLVDTTIMNTVLKCQCSLQDVVFIFMLCI